MKLIKIGEINKLKVLRKKDYGYFLDGQTKEKSDDILLPNQNIVDDSYHFSSNPIQKPFLRIP